MTLTINITISPTVNMPSCHCDISYLVQKQLVSCGRQLVPIVFAEKVGSHISNKMVAKAKALA